MALNRSEVVAGAPPRRRTALTRYGGTAAVLNTHSSEGRLEERKTRAELIPPARDSASARLGSQFERPGIRSMRQAAVERSK